jgi:hypothetical protein
MDSRDSFTNSRIEKLRVRIKKAERLRNRSEKMARKYGHDIQHMKDLIYKIQKH